MPITFTITKNRQTLEKQWAFLAEWVQGNQQFELRQFSAAVLVCLGLYLLLYFFTSENQLIVLKAMALIVIALLGDIVVVRYVVLRLENSKSKRRLGVFLDSITANQLNYSVQIDEEKVTIVSTEGTYNLPWKEFSRFGIHNDTVYLFNEVRKLNSLFWDRSEIGSDSFSALLALLKDKEIVQTF